MKSASNVLLSLILLTGCRGVQQERFLANVRINDKPVCFAYDTGAGATVVHTRSAKRLGLKVAEPPSSSKPSPGSVSIGHTDFCRFTVGRETHTLRLATVHLPWPWDGLFDFDGVIGWPDLADDFFVIDANDDAIKSVGCLPQDTNGWFKLPLYRRTDVLALQVPRADGKTGVLEVDTGNPEGISLSPARWKEWRTTHPHAHGAWQFNFMPGSGPAIGRQYKADDLAIGPLTWKHVTIRKARVTETSIAERGDVFEASIGIEALRQLNLTIDRTNHMAYVRRSPDWIPGQVARRRNAPRRDMASTNSTVRLNFKEHEFADLAQAAFDSGKFGEAITNLTRLLERQPANAGARALRGQALFRLHAAEGSATNLDRSLGDLSRALEQDPGITPAYYWRGSINYVAQRWDDAVTDYRHFCEKAPDAASYPQFYIWLIRARQGNQAAVNGELPEWLGPGQGAKAGRWERSVGAFLLGRMSEDDFLHAALGAQDSGRQCEAWFYAGMKRRLSGDTARARDYLQRCIATDRKDFDEYNFAAAELRLL
jgi:lipoprotein NlpI